MILFNTKFKSKLLDIAFVNSAGVTFEKTARIDVYDDSDKLVDSKGFAYISIEEIYEKIEAKMPLNLDNCFVHNFSLTAYKRLRGLEKTDVVNLVDFSAKDSIFYSNFETDFSFSKFEGEKTDFTGTYFAHGNVNFQNSQFLVNEISFNGGSFCAKSVDFSRMKVHKGDFIFKNIICSEGNINFQRASFAKGNHSFANTVFGDGDFKFSDVRFESGKVSFKISEFGNGEKDFRFSSFGDSFVDFEMVNFNDGDVNFRRVNFGAGKTSFNRAIFGNGDITFQECFKKLTTDNEVKDKHYSSSKEHKKSFLMKFVNFGSGYFNFEKAQMHDVDVSFNKAIFESGAKSRISFNRSCFKKISFRSCHLDDYMDLRLAKCDYLDLSNTVIRDVIDIKAYDFPMEVKVLDISHMRLLGIINIDWHRNKVLDLIMRQKHNSNWNYADQFRVLKENFNKTGRYEDEDLAYVQFKRYEEKAKFEDAIAEKPATMCWQYPLYYFKVLVYDLIGQYATNPIRVVFSVIISCIAFGLLYAGLVLGSAETVIQGIDPDMGVAATVIKSCYFSAITFFTIGYGDVLPQTHLTEFLAAFEGFVGVFLMSYFTVAFVRKILR